MSNVLRNIPSVNELLDRPPLRTLIQKANRTTVVAGVRRFLDNLRTEMQTAAADIKVPAPAELAERIARWIAVEDAPNLRPVINATGVLLHTGLGRAPLAESAVAAIAAIAGGYASVEVDVATGDRSQRVRDVQKRLRQLTGAEAAVVVNNNAGATLLALAALASGREVIVSRGQLVEIGGSFRLPEVMQFSGARLREVGTTNKTRIEDYRDAIRPETAALMRVHTSNYAIVGFTQQASLEELVQLGAKRNLPVIDDIGSGALRDFSPYGVAGEPVAGQSIRTGADVVLFSGDKLLGGPQCGVILGKRALIDRIAKHPLMRALRVDKITLSALLETLRLHEDPQTAEQAVPLLMLLGTSPDNLRNRAERMAPQMEESRSIRSAEAIESCTYLGGGSLPAQQIPTWCVALEPAHGTVDGLAAALREASPSVFGRIQKDRLLLDLRSVFPKQDMQLVEVVRGLDGARQAEAAGAESGEPTPPAPCESSETT